MEILSTVGLTSHLTKCDIFDRIEELPDGSEILLPAFCSDGKNVYNVKMLRAIMKDDKCSVLITGQSGTGKEVIFNCIKKYTQRSKDKIRELNCAGLADSNLVDSALFGHEAGAFTGALTKRNGLLESCQNGILFLDEIGWLPKATQAKLLRFMETGKYFQLGSDVEIEARNVRIIVATNKKVFANEVEKNRDDRDSDVVLLHDLYFRFDHHIALPTLYERGIDIFWFIAQPGFLGNSVFKRISLRMLFSLLHVKWDGNIRQLKKYCEKSIFMRSCVALDTEKALDLFDDPRFVSQNGQSERVFLARVFIAGTEKFEQESVPKIFDNDVEKTHHYISSPSYEHLLALFWDIVTSADNPRINFPINYMQELLYATDRKKPENRKIASPDVLYTNLCNIITEIWLSHFVNHNIQPDEECYEIYERLKNALYEYKRRGIPDSTCLAEAMYIIRKMSYLAKETSYVKLGSKEERLEELRKRQIEDRFQDWINSFEAAKQEVPADLEEHLTRLTLDSRLKSICRYYYQGLSAPKISEKLEEEGLDNSSKDQINKNLAKLRVDHPELLVFIPERKRGRQKSV